MRKWISRHKWDLLLVFGVLTLAVLLGCILRFSPREPATVAVVSVSGTPVATYPLNKDAEYRIEGLGGYNLVTIQNGVVSVSEADCPNRLCVKSHPISRPGETIVCLPHRVVVRIAGDDVLDGEVK